MKSFPYGIPYVFLFTEGGVFYLTTTYALLLTEMGVKVLEFYTQLPITKWHEVINDQTIADAILDRLVHNAYKINMKGGSMRKKINKVPTS